MFCCPRWLLSNKDAPEADNKTCKAKMFLRWLLSNKDAPESDNKTCKAKMFLRWLLWHLYYIITILETF
jgi:hypothetical protein